MDSVVNRSNKFLIFLIGFLLIPVNLFSITVRAKLYSAKKDQPERNLSIVIFETKKTFQTDKEGFVNLEFPAAGEYTLRLLRDTGMQELKFNATENESRTIYTDKINIPKGGIVVEGDREKTVASRTKVRYEEIKRMPGTFGEALRALETLPGIIPNIGFGGGANGIIVRGADPNSNTFLYDDLPILYPYHLDGLTSVIHNDLIKSIDLYRGAFPANYNNATGGIIEIETVDSVKTKKGAFQTSLWNTTAYSATPFSDGKGYIAIAGKVGYLDKTIGASGLLPDGIRLPRYNDSQIKFVYNFSSNHQVSFYNLTAQDNFALAATTNQGNDPTKDPFGSFAGGRFNIGQSFRTTALRYTWTPGDKFNNRFTLINYDPITQFNIGLGSIVGKRFTRPAYLGLRQDASWNITSNIKFDFGSEYRQLSFRTYGEEIFLRDPTNPSPNPFNTSNPDFLTRPLNIKGSSSYYNLYTTIKLKYGNFQFEPGVRYDYIEAIKNGALGPRATLSYSIPEILNGLILFGSAGDVTRFPGNTSFNSQTGNPDLRFEKARKTGIGVEQKFAQLYELKIEGFRNEFRQTIVDDPYISDPIGLNPDKSQLATQPFVTNRPRNFSNRGSGWSHGYELLFRKNSKTGLRDWFGWISYTWSQSFQNTNIYQIYDGDTFQYSSLERRVLAEFYNNSKEQLAVWDRTHVANVIYGWRINDEYQIGGRWSYLTSTPIQPIIGDDGGRFVNPANGLNYWNPKYSNNPFSSEYGNVKRGRDFHRLDIRIDKFENYSWGYLNWYIELINIYIRKNTNGESFDNSRPFSATNPIPAETFGTLVLPGNQVIPFFNIGMEVHF